MRNPARERSRNLNREVWESPSVYGGEDVKIDIVRGFGVLGFWGFGVLVKISLSPYLPISLSSYLPIFLSPNSYGSCLAFY
ncbi:MAG: hypothetical protein IM329_04535 [Microcystis sp. M112S1]|nr:hypothetical protein [Microcystis sp. M112S1]